MAIREYKCPCCGGAIAFDSTLQKMKCPFCDTEFEMETLAAYDQDLNEDQADQLNWKPETGQDWQPGETEGMRIYVCKSCGGEIIGDENTAATACPYCGNPVVMMGQFKGELKPDLVIPFKLDKEQAKKGLEQHLKGKRLLPKIFHDKNHIDEIKGIYVPFWLFDAKANANVRYRATKTRMWREGNYQATETSFFSVVRAGSLQFEGVAVDGSSKITDELMESIEPFDLSEGVSFQTAYLAGYLADKYDVSAKDSEPRANERVKASTHTVFENTVQGYDSIQLESESVQLTDGRTRYALYPVWLLNTTYEGKQYTFAMNGQTGKFVGDLPVDKGAYWKWFALLTGIGAAATYALSWLIHMM